MNTYITLLRGINVGGHKKMSMAELRTLLTKKGLKDVKTYIQSGNVVFQSSLKDKSKIEKLIKQAILDYFGFEVPTLVRTTYEIEHILESCPFPNEKKVASYFILLSEAPKNEDIEIINQASYPDEEFQITPKCIYIHYNLGAGKAKLSVNWFEKKLDVSGTARNYRTMIKLLDLSA